MDTDDIVEPDAEAFDESADTSDIKAEAVTGDYPESDQGQDPEATS
jgi:hypothetical protein